jgi:hypothetical protein
MMLYVVIFVGLFLTFSFSIMSIFDGGIGFRSHKKLIIEEANSLGLTNVSVQQMNGFGRTFQYVVLYLNEKNVGLAKECIVSKKKVYWLDRF